MWTVGYSVPFPKAAERGLGQRGVWQGELQTDMAQTTQRPWHRWELDALEQGKKTGVTSWLHSKQRVGSQEP